MVELDRLGRWFREFGAANADDSPLYGRLCAAIAEDAALLAIAADTPRPQPNLFLAAVHFLVLEADAPFPSAWADYRDFCLDHRQRIVALQHTRRTQTNEVGRCSVLLPVLSLLPQPLALVDLGASAGLNLLVDRYHYSYSDGQVAGDPGSPVHLTCAVRGSAPLPPMEVPEIADRVGIDIDPADITDPATALWLEACVFADQSERRARLRAALSVARSSPPSLVRGDTVETLPSVIASVPTNAHLCLLSTWALAYLSKEARAALFDIVRSMDRPLSWVTAEVPGVAPSVPAPEGSTRDRTLLALLDRPLAWVHPHGAWIEWL